MRDRHHRVALTVNGEAHELAVDSRVTLADALRRDLGLTGTRLGCEHGSCGTCTVLLDGEPVRACLTLAVQAGGREVETVEGLADGEELAPLQEAFVRHGALQCGYCTSGFLMLGTALLRERPPPPPQEVRDTIASNLCRCTGYEGIARAVAECLPQAGEAGDRR